MVALTTKGWFNYVKALNPWKPSKTQLRAMAHRNQAARIRARYDAAQTTAENAEHWSMADDLSGMAANSLAVRRILRKRSRYEVANNCYACGILLTIANDLVGTGPRIQMSSDDKAANKVIEKEFMAWARAVNLAQKLRTAVVTKKRDGEVFARFFTNPGTCSPVQLDIELLEQDQVTTPALVPDEWHIDGITYDQSHNPKTYQILRQHPGDLLVTNWTPDDVPASQVLHWYRIDRPGQRRGIPEITPALPLFAQLRRFTLSVLTASETAADHAAVLESTAALSNEGVDGDLSSINPFDDVAYARGMLTAVPFGWKLSQLRAEQPTTTYGMFKAEILNEIARAIHVPYNVAAGNSAGYNYSSGRLDHKGYYGAIGIEQSELEQIWLDKIFRAWYAEARLVRREDGTPLVPTIDLSYRPWSFFWDPPADIDPLKTAQGRQIDLMCGATTPQEVWAAKGLEWDKAQEQMAEALGMTVPQYQKLLAQKLFGDLASVAPETDAEARRRRRARGTRGRKRSLAGAVRSFLHGGKA